MNSSSTKTRELIAALAVFIVIVAIVTTAAVTSPKKQTTKTTTATTGKDNVALSATQAAAGSAYKNGTFKGSGSYDSPGGPESFYLSVTVKDDVVTSTSATSGSQDFTSRQYQMQFISGYKQLVVGKKLASIGGLGAIAGSSLTTQGFEKALAQIKQEAKQS